MSKFKDSIKDGIIYYKDELNDDFGEVGLSRPPVPKGYKYKRTNPFNNFLSNILYYGLGVPVIGLFCFCHGIRVKNRHVLKRLKKTGAFIYSNHVSISDVFKFQSFVCPPKRVNIIGYSDSLSMPIVRNLCRAFGYLPLPLKNDKDNFLALNEAAGWYVKKKHQYVLIFPEAHIWPYYTGIRNFPHASFYYPAKSNSPVLPTVTIWKKRKFRKKPRQVVIIGRPIYPDPTLDANENMMILHQQCLEQMKKIASNNKQQEYVTYKKIED